MKAHAITSKSGGDLWTMANLLLTRSPAWKQINKGTFQHKTVSATIRKHDENTLVCTGTSPFGNVPSAGGLLGRFQSTRYLLLELARELNQQDAALGAEVVVVETTSPERLSGWVLFVLVPVAIGLLAYGLLALLRA